MPRFDPNTVSLAQIKQDLEQLRKDEAPDVLVGLNNEGRLVQIAYDEGRCTRSEYTKYSDNLSAYLQLKASTGYLYPQQLQAIEYYLQQISERDVTTVEPNFSTLPAQAKPEQPSAITEEVETVKPNLSMQTNQPELEQSFAITEELQTLNEVHKIIVERHGIYVSSLYLLKVVNKLNDAGQLDNHECLKKAYLLITAIIHSDYYKSDQNTLEKIKDTIDKIPESFFKKLLHAGMSADTSATMATLVAKAFTLEPAEAEAFEQIYGKSDNIQEMKATLETCQHLKEQGCYFPLPVLLPGIRKNPGKALQLATHPFGKSSADSRHATNSLLRRCLLIHANLGDTSKEAERYLTTINLWHNPQILDQIPPLHKYRDLYAALNRKSLSPDTLLFALADNQMTPEVVECLNHLSIYELKKIHNKATQSTIMLVSKVVDDDGALPTTATIKACSDIQRYINDKMTSDEKDVKRERMEKLLENVGHNIMCQIPAINLVEQVAGELFTESEDDKKSAELKEHLLAWAKACQNQRDRDHFATYNQNQQALLIKARRHMAIITLQSLSKELKDIEPLVTVSRTLENLTEGLEYNIKAQSPEQLNFIAQQLREFGLKPGQRTISNADCGFAAMALMTGESPHQVRTAAAQAAKDLHTFLQTADLTTIEGDEDYKKRIEQGAGFFKDFQLYKQGLLSPEERANYLKADIQEAQTSQDPENYWLNPEDLPYIAIAYNTPVFLFTPDSPYSESLQCTYATPEGELIECNTEGQYQTCINLAIDQI